MSPLAKHPRVFFQLAATVFTALLAVPSALAQAELIITEINYHTPEITETQEFVEIKNVGDEPQSMTGWTMGGVGDVTFTQTVVEPGGFLIVAQSSTGFSAKYGFTPGATFTGSLRNSGEKVELVDPDLNSVFSVDYWDGGDPSVGLEAEEADRPLWPKDPDGDGYTLVPFNPNSNPDPDDFRNWRPSINLGGSPGADEPLPDPLQPIFINEIRTRDGGATNDSIEFFNPNPVAVDISDWFLADDVDNPDESPVPEGTVVPAGGYVVLVNGEDGFAIGLSSQGDGVFLYSADAGGNLTGFVNGFYFMASADGRTFSRYINSVGAEQFPAAASTLGFANAAPDVGPVVITEIMYNPLVATDEFIEIQNISGATVPLYDPLFPSNNWRVEGISFILNGAQPELAAGEIALITQSNPADFRTKFDVPAGVKIFGPYTGSLNNGGEEVALQRPENLDDLMVVTSYINVDVVQYDNSAPWPTDAAGLGRSLVRRDRSAYGNDPINWQSSLLLDGSPGTIFDYTGPEILVNEVLAHTDIPQVDVIELHNPTGSAVDIGGWYLSDDRDIPKKFLIPTGTTIPAGGFWAVNQDNDGIENSAPANYFGNAFQISSRGDQIYLFSADGAGDLTGYRHGWSFRATVNGSVADGSLSLGRHVDTFSREHFTKQVLSFEVNRFTPNPAGAANNPPEVGPVVFTEINFDPAPGGVEFIEMKNISGGTVFLYDTSISGNPNNTWQLDGVSFSFPNTNPRQSLPAGAVAIILPEGTDVAAFRAANNVPDEPAAFVYGGVGGGYTGALNNGGEELALLRPDNPDMVNNVTIVPLIAVDVVNYRDSAFWPATGAGVPLEKFNLAGFSDDPIFWRAASAAGGTPGTTPQGLFYDLWAVQNFSSDALAQSAGTGCDEDVNGDGFGNLFAYAFGYDPAITPAGDLLPQVAIVSESDSAYPAISFRRQIASTDLSYQIESSPDLNTWTPIAGVEFAPFETNGDGTETVHFRSAESTTDEMRLFLRVRVSKN